MSDDSSKAVVVTVRWWVAFLFAISVYMFSAACLLFVANLFARETTFSNSFIYSISSLVTILSTLAFLNLQNIKPNDFFGKFALRQVLFTPLYYIGYVILSRIARTIVGLIPGVDTNQKQDFGLQADGPLQLVVIFIALVILPPISEEILFRGLLYRSFRKPFGKVAAAIIISLLFGASHGQWNVAADTFVLSLVLIYLVEKSNSLWPAIALHFFKNTVAVLLVFVFKVS